MTRMAPLLRWRKRGNVSAPSPPTFYYRRDTLRFRGPFPKGGYDVHDGKHSEAETAQASVHRGVQGGSGAAGA